MKLILLSLIFITGCIGQESPKPKPHTILFEPTKAQLEQLKILEQVLIHDNAKIRKEALNKIKLFDSKLQRYFMDTLRKKDHPELQCTP